MLEIHNIPDGGINHKDPGVFSYVTDHSIVSQPTIVSSAGTMYTPVYTEKGVTGVVKSFYGVSGYQKMVEQYGEPNITRFGLPYTAAALHLLANGNVVLQSVKHESATNAAFIMYLQIETKNENSSSIEKTLGWIRGDGSGFVEDPYAGTEAGLEKPTSQHIVHKVYTSRLSFVTKELKEIRSVDDLTLLAQSEFDQELSNPNPGNKRLFPLIYGMYNGKGSYGNNFEFITRSEKNTVNGRPIFTSYIRDKRRSEEVANSRQTVSLNNEVFEGAIPLFIERQYQDDTAGDEFVIKTLDHSNMNALAKIIQSLFARTTLFTTGSALAGTQAKALEERVAAVKELFDKPNDPNWHAMRYFNPTDMSALGNIFQVSNAGRIPFTGGDDGVLKDMEEFDWEKEFNIAPAGQTEKKEKVLAKLFSNAFLGVYSRELFSLQANNADYVIDMGYPLSVKEAMIGFSEKRNDIQVIFNAPISAKTDTEAINFKKKFNWESRNFLYCPGNFNFIDPSSNRMFRVPMSFAIMNNIIAHYSRGYMESIAGTSNGLISRVESKGYRALGDLSSENNDKLLDAGYIVCKVYGNGQLWLNSQKTNYKIRETSKLQEFHNNSIINRILKTLYTILQDDLHKLTSADQVAAIEAHVNNALDIFRPKVDDIQYSCGFKSAYDKAFGLLTHDISIKFRGTIKYHVIHIDALPESA